MNPMANQLDQLDTSIQIVTPENIAFRYQVAGPFCRLPAFLIDLVLRAVIWIATGLGFGFLFALLGIPDLGFGLWLVLWFLLAWFYGGIFETLWNGQTPGKRLTHLRVLSVDGQPINAHQAILRNILRAADAQPLFFFQVGLVAMTLNDRFQRLGDLASGTMVVIEKPRWLRDLVRIRDPQVLRLADEIPAGFVPTPSLARALAGYVDRRLSFPPPRRLEIARHLAVPLAQKFGLPPYTNPDALLSAAYHRGFVTDQPKRPIQPLPGSPFAPDPDAPARAVNDRQPGQPVP